MNESQKTHYMLTELRGEFRGAWFHKTAEKIRGGLPDVAAVVNGRAVYIECKDLAPNQLRNTAPTDLQRKALLALHRAGALVLLVVFTKGRSWREHEVWEIDPVSGFDPAFYDWFRPSKHATILEQLRSLSR